MKSLSEKKQTPRGRKRAKRLGSILDWSSLLLSLLMLFRGRVSLPWVLTGLCFSLIALTAYLLYPQYYTLTDPKKNRYPGAKVKTTRLSYAIALPFCLPVLFLHSFRIGGWQLLLLYSLLGGVLLTLLLGCLSRELREHRGLLVTTLLVAVIGLYGILGAFNHIANTDPAPAKERAVVEVDVRIGRRRRSYCEVVMGNGEHLHLPISLATARELQPGDRVWVVCDTGALGVEYAYFAGKQP